MEVKTKISTQRFGRNSTLGKIGVLLGGPSSEREISFKSGHAIYDALRQAGMEVVTIDITTDNVEDNLRLIRSCDIDCAFLALHGRFGEDGQIQAILDSIAIPYTGSGAGASKLAMDKVASRKVLEIRGIAVPKYIVINKNSLYHDLLSKNNFKFPLVIKPVSHGSSIGLSIIDSMKDLSAAVVHAFRYDEHVLIEEFIKGREVTVGILEEKALPVIEIIPKKRFFDYEAKYQAGMTDYIIPAEFAQAIAERIQETAVSVHKLLGCFAFSRVDLILGEDGIPYVLELNSIPGFTPTSLLPKAARVAGIEFTELCLKLIHLAYAKT